MTKWVGEAWDHIFKSGKYSPDRNFERTGCLLTLDGSEDHKVHIQGLPAYKPPAPLSEQTNVQALQLEQEFVETPELGVQEHFIDKIEEEHQIEIELGGDAGNNEQIGNPDEEEFIFYCDRHFFFVPHHQAF